MRLRGVAWQTRRCRNCTRNRHFCGSRVEAKVTDRRSAGRSEKMGFPGAYPLPGLRVGPTTVICAAAQQCCVTTGLPSVEAGPPAGRRSLTPPLARLRPSAAARTPRKSHPPSRCSQRADARPKPPYSATAQVAWSAARHRANSPRLGEPHPSRRDGACVEFARHAYLTRERIQML